MINTKNKLINKIYNLDELGKYNCTVLCFLTFEEIILTIVYLINAIQGTFNVILDSALTLLFLATIILGWTKFIKKPNNNFNKHLVSYGFALFYTIILIGSNNTSSVTYVIPMVIAITVYRDIKYSAKICICIVIENIIFSFLYYNGTLNAQSNLEQILLQLLIITLACICGVYVSFINLHISNEKLKSINNQKNTLTDMIKKITTKSHNISDKVTEIEGKMNILETSSIDTKNSMAEVKTGSTNTADAVQNQLIKTDEIQEHIKTVKSASETIDSNVMESQNLIGDGQNSIDNLINYGKISSQSSTKVKVELEKLNEYTSKMNSIVEVIDNVADETSLLSLNASIEAARAGEAGKGFAVVASEISDLASQTQSATGNIGSLIENITKELSIVVELINTLIENNETQNNYAINTAENFNKISKNSSNIKILCSELNNNINILDAANISITDDIQTISAITEEVSAHSENTFEISNKNVEIVKAVKSLVNLLNEESNELKKLGNK